MMEIKGRTQDLNVLLLSTYSRLKNLIYEDIPKVIWEKKFKLMENTPKDKILQFEPE